MIQPLWRPVRRVLKKLKIELPYDPAIPLLGIYPEKTIIQKESWVDQKPQLQKDREDEKAEGYVPDERTRKNPRKTTK